LYHSGTYDSDSIIDTTGLIPTMGSGYIKNLAIKNSSLTAGAGVGAFIGKTARDALEGIILIENCFVDEDVNLVASDGDSSCGGFIGYSTVRNEVTIKNCYCLTTKLNCATPYKTNAFVGQTWLSPYRLINCYSISSPFNSFNLSERLSSLVKTEGFGKVYKNVYSATTRNYYSNEIVNGVYAFTKVTDSNMQGLDVLNNENKMPKLKDICVATSKYPILKAFASSTEESISSIANIFPLITNMDISVETKGQAGSFKVEPNTMYFLSGTESNACFHDAPVVDSTSETGYKKYPKKYIAVIVGQLVNGVARSYAIEFSGGNLLTLSYGNWPLDAITGSYTMTLGYAAGSTVIIWKNKSV
jgi:hypothetical protein